jgi:serine/threonine protein kinase
MSASHLIGQKVGEYEVTRRIGMGGMGAVFEGKHPLIGKKVAIKVLQPQFSEDEAQMKRFLSEAVAVNEIRHRGIVDIFGFGQLPDGSHYIIMEYLEGMSFEQLLKTRKSLPPVEALGLLEEVLDAVAAAHQAQIVHRDLKPSNLFLVDVGRGRPFVKLLDFGVAKLSKDERGERKVEATGIVGTPIYMAPEQVNGLRAGPEADIYALGVVLFELITGRPPFKADNPVEMMTRHLDAKPPKVSEVKAGVPPEIDRLVDRMLSKRPQDRPQDAEELRAEVARLRSRLDLPIRRGAPVQRPAIEDDVGPTVVRVVKRGGNGSTVPDITPVESRSVGRVDFNERTQIASVPLRPEPEVPWSGNTPVKTLSGDSDPDLGVRPTMIGGPSLGGGARVTAEQPMLDGESPVPTVPIKGGFDGPMPNFEKASDRKPSPTKLTSQSSPTLSATDYAEAEKVLKSEFSVTDPSGKPYHPDTQPPSHARAAEKRQQDLGTLILVVGLVAAAIVGLAVFVLIGSFQR